MTATARKYQTKQTHFLSKKLPGGGAAGNQTVQLGRIPNGAGVLNIFTMVRTAATGGVPTVSFGPSGSPAAYFAAAGGPITTVGRNVVTLIATATLSVSADTDLVAVIGGAPTGGGDLDFIVEFYVAEDLDIGLT